MRTLCSILSLAGLLFTSCNDDIFVSPIQELPDSITLPGYDGVQTIQIQRKGLRGVSFDNDYTFQTYEEYYDHDGIGIDRPSNIDDVAKAIYYSRMFAVEFYLDGEEAKIVVLDNAYPDGMQMRVNLDYGYTAKTVTLDIAGGRPHVMTQLSYYIDHPIVGTTTDNVNHQNLFNNTDRELQMEIYPYREAQSKLVLTPHEEDSWSNGAVGEVLVPNYVDGEWRIVNATTTEATIGKTTYFTSSCVNMNEKCFVTVPAHSSVRVDVAIVYATLDSEYITSVWLPGTEYWWIVEGKYHLMQPIGYTIETTPLEL